MSGHVSLPGSVAADSIAKEATSKVICYLKELSVVIFAARFFVLSAPFLARWVESFAGYQTESGDTVQVFHSSFSSFRREEAKSRSSYLSYLPDTWTFVAWRFSTCLYALLSTPYCD
jgi:hypothetical protein